MTFDKGRNTDSKGNEEFLLYLLFEIKSLSKNSFTSFSTSPTSGGHKVKTNHPWMGIIHPGPWTQLPPAPAPSTPPRSSSVPAMQGRWLRRRVPPPNPFGDEMDDETEASASEKVSKTEAANQMKPSRATSQSENEGTLPNDSGATRVPVTISDSGNAAAKSKPEDKAKPPDHRTSRAEARGADFEFGAAYLTEEGGFEAPDSASGPGSPGGVPDLAGAAAGLCLADMTKAGAVGGLAMAAGGPTTSDAAQSHPLPTSVSVPVLTSASPQRSSMLTDLTEGNESVQVSSQAKVR